jgi:hypothetical protein
LAYLGCGCFLSHGLSLGLLFWCITCEDSWGFSTWNHIFCNPCPKCPYRTHDSLAGDRHAKKTTTASCPSRSKICKTHLRSHQVNVLSLSAHLRLCQLSQLSIVWVSFEIFWGLWVASLATGPAQRPALPWPDHIGTFAAGPRRPPAAAAHLRGLWRRSFQGISKVNEEWSPTTPLGKILVRYGSKMCRSAIKQHIFKGFCAVLSLIRASDGCVRMPDQPGLCSLGLASSRRAPWHPQVPEHPRQDRPRPRFKPYETPYETPWNATLPHEIPGNTMGRCSPSIAIAQNLSRRTLNHIFVKDTFPVQMWHYQKHKLRRTTTWD